ncbi:MAG: YncE family protein [Candidatus Acidiferrales bacterium]
MSKRHFPAWFCKACLFSTSFLLLSAAGAYAAPQGTSYHVVRRMQVGGEGGWDYLRVDPDTHRLFVSRGTHVMVVDENSGKVIGDIPDTKGVHGIALAPDLGKGFTSNGGAATVTVFDLKTLKPTGSIKTTGDNPDSIIYDPQTKRVFTLNGKSSNATAIDAVSEKVVGTVDLGGKPEEPALDGKGNMFVNLEDKSSIMEFDTKTLAVKGTWPLAPCEGPSALAFDPAHHRLFAACDKVMAVVNADTGKVVAAPPIGGDPDGDGFDPATGLVFASCREGLVSILHQDSADKYSAVGNVTTQFGTRTMTIDPKTHHVFTVTADFKAAAAPTPENPRPRPQPIAGSFVILELAQ